MRQGVLVQDSCILYAMKEPRGPRTQSGLLPSLLGGVTAAALVMGIEWVFRPSPFSAADGSRNSTLEGDVLKKSADMLDALNSIRRDVEAMRMELSVAENRATARPISSETQPASQAVAQVIEGLNRIEASLRALSDDSQLGGPPDLVRKSELHEYLSAGTSIPTDGWRFLSPQQLSDRYGPPDVVTAESDGIVRWCYRWDDEAQVCFRLSQGMALSIETIRPH